MAGHEEEGREYPPAMWSPLVMSLSLSLSPIAIAGAAGTLRTIMATR
jgi:hypothetical protein